MTADEAFDVLVERCGAHEGDRVQFRFHWPHCREFRFMGALGFGGKVYNQGRRVWVDCYREDLTAERATVINLTNAVLTDLTAGDPYPLRG